MFRVFIRLDARRGFEPRFPDSESGVLPDRRTGNNLGVPGETRTRTDKALDLVTLPIGLQGHIWSGGRESNPRPSVWQTGALPLSYLRILTKLNRRMILISLS
jgi:hypothetical protein